jgi:hypothetical protein
VREQVRPPERLVRPVRVLQSDLSAQLLCHSKGFDRAETSDAIAPIGVLVPARRRPVSGNKLANAAGDHVRIVAPSPEVFAVMVSNAGATTPTALDDQLLDREAEVTRRLLQIPSQ